MNDADKTSGNIAVAPDGAAEGATAFARGLFQRTPRVWVTQVLVGLNLVVFAAMVVAGVGLLSPSIDGLIRWGANYGPRTTSGEWWRLLTSVFVHIGIIHVGMNMIGLWQIGFLVERLLGNRGFLLVYLFAGVCGSLTSVGWNPAVVSAGASGAVFGVYGALSAFLIRHRGSIPRAALQPLQRSAVFFVGLNIVYGMQIKGIDMGAHVGGFVGGFLGALLISRPVGGDSNARGRGPRELALLVLGIALVAIGPRVLPRAADVQAELTAFGAMERVAINTYNGALNQRRTDRVSDAEMARVIDEQILPPWRDFQRRLAGLHRVPPAHKKQLEEVSRYLALRERGWSTFSEALRSNDRAKADQAGELLKEADSVLNGPAATE